MLVIVDMTGKILATWDAWYANASQEAEAFIEEHGLEMVKDEITFGGNWVIWVKGGQHGKTELV